MTLRRQDAWPVGAVGFVLAVSAAWWSFALWQVPGAPEWVERARSVCFNLTESGLPDTKGWMLLFGQPPAMIALFAVVWPGELKNSFRHLRSYAGGRLLLGGTTLLVATGLTLAMARVSSARLTAVTLDDGVTPETYPRLDRPWPSSDGLVDQHGDDFGLESLTGRRALVAFAFGHCETVCPLVVHAARGARLESGDDLSIVVLTLDPWRDTPSRLTSLVDQFELDTGRDFVLSGAVESVELALDAWNIPRTRDIKTGDVSHPALVYLVEGDGTVAYASRGGVGQLTELVGRLR